MRHLSFCYGVSIVFLSVSLAPQLMADLGAARSFAVLSSGSGVTFRNRNTVNKVPIPGAATCPAAAGCSSAVGGSSISMGPGNPAAPGQIHGDVIASAPQGIRCGSGSAAICLGNDNQVSGACITGGGAVSSPTECAGGADTLGTNAKLTLLANAGPDASAFSSFLAALPSTQTLAPINLGVGSTGVINATSGLNIIRIPSLITGTNATLTIQGTATSLVAIIVGTAPAPGVLSIGNGSAVQLAGGLTPDHVIFDVLGSGVVLLGNGARFNGTILAPGQGFASGNGNTPQPIVINGALLFGQAVSFGNNVTVNFYPLAQVARPVTVGVVGTVNIGSLPPPVEGQGGADADPEVPPIEEPPGQFAPPAVGSSISLTNPSGSPLLPKIAFAPRDTTPSNAPLIDAIQFQGLAEGGTIAPPDTQMAAGNTRVLEMVNNGGAFFGKLGGGMIGSSFDLGSLFITTPGTGTDPRVVFDPASHTYYAAYELRTPGGDDIRLGVATDPGDTWTIYEVAGNTTDTCFDQPKLGFSGDKITLSWNDYKNAKSCSTLPGSNFVGVEYIVVQKAGVLNRDNSVPAVIWGPDSGRFPVVPVVSLSATNTQYAATKGVGGSNFGVMAFTGVPGISDVNISSDNSYDIGKSAAAPDAQQPAGGNASIKSGDDRLLDAVWQNGNLWGSFTESCQTPSRACNRFVQVRTTDGSVQTNVTLLSDSLDLYYPAVSLTSNGDLVFGLTISSSTLNPTATVAGVPGAVFGPVVFGIGYQSGDQAYSSTDRWGDYSAAVTDPNDPTVVWVAQEFGGVKKKIGTSGTWGTSIAAVFFSTVIIP